MPRLFRSKCVVALAMTGIAALALPKGAFAQSVVADFQAAPPQTPAAPTAPGNTVPPAPSPPSPAVAAPNSTAPNSNAIAEAQTTSTPGIGGAGAAQQFSLATTPNMIGDLLGGNYMFVTGEFSGKLPTGGNIPIAGGDRQGKISEDTSPIPTDRVFADYNHFNSAALTSDGRVIDVNRYTFGVEKTFFDGACSIEIRAPIVSGLSANEFVPVGASDNEGTALGDVSIIPKWLFARADTWAASVGMSISLPTAPDVSNTVETAEITRIEDESLHLEPFVGLLLAPSTRLFSISYVQLDFDANGSPVTSRLLGGQPVGGGPTIYDGRLRDPTFLYVDVSVGYWLFDVRDESRGSWALGGYVSGIAPIVEMHYTTSLQAFSTHVSTVSSPFAGEDTLDMTAGLSFQLGPMSNLTLAACAPLLTSQRDKEFDSELIVEFDRFF